MASYSSYVSYLARRWYSSRSAAGRLNASVSTREKASAVAATTAATAVAGLYLLHPLSHHSQEESAIEMALYKYMRNNHTISHCDAAAAATTTTTTTTVDSTSTKTSDNIKTTTKPETDPTTTMDTKEEYYYNLFPKRQLWRPVKEYPLWDTNWDGLQPLPQPPLLPTTTTTTTTTSPQLKQQQQEEAQKLARQKAEHEQQRRIRTEGVTRHVILIRHGQYDESSKDDAKRILTPLGREQAALTGKRIAEMIQGVVEMTTTAHDNDGDDNLKKEARRSKHQPSDKIATPCHVTFLHSSDLTRAKETADIMEDEIRLHLSEANHSRSTTTAMQRSKPDPLLNEGRPCPTIPGSKVISEKIIRQTDTDHARIEEAFRKYFYRHSTGTTTTANAAGNAAITESTTTISPSPHKHEFEIIVCHANVIRYFLMRALQLPPEAWLRWCNLNCSLTYITIRPTGSVSCRMFGDIGHLPYSKHTFSQHAGYNW